MGQQNSHNKHRVQQSNEQNFLKYVKNGNVEKVKRLIIHGNLDVNAEILYEGKLQRPLLTAIENIREKNDNFFNISCMLLDCKDVDVNINNSRTMLGLICENEQKNYSWCGTAFERSSNKNE